MTYFNNKNNYDSDEIFGPWSEMFPKVIIFLIINILCLDKKAMWSYSFCSIIKFWMDLKAKVDNWQLSVLTTMKLIIQSAIIHVNQ